VPTVPVVSSAVVISSGDKAVLLAIACCPCGDDADTSPTPGTYTNPVSEILRSEIVLDRGITVLGRYIG
jgi:hypothetical protein